MKNLLFVLFCGVALANTETAKPHLDSQTVFDIHTQMLRLTSDDPAVRANAAVALSTRHYLNVQAVLKNSLSKEADAQVVTALEAALKGVEGQPLVEVSALQFPEQWVDEAVKAKSEVKLKEMLKLPEWIPAVLLAEELPAFVELILESPEIKESEEGLMWKKAILESHVPGSEKAKAMVRETVSCPEMLAE